MPKVQKIERHFLCRRKNKDDIRSTELEFQEYTGRHDETS